MRGVQEPGPDGITRRVQKLVHPGIRAVSGNAFITAQPINSNTLVHGESPSSVSLLHFITPGGDDQTSVVDLNERDALLGSLLTIAADRRCMVIPEVFAAQEGSPSSIPIGLAHQVDPTLTAPMPPWKRVNKTMIELVARLTSMGEEDASAILAAIHMHYSSSLLFTRDLTGAYALAVGGIEALAARFGPKYSDWSDWDRSNDWDNFFLSSNFSESQARDTRNKLLESIHIRLGETFASYLCDSVPGSFWEERVKNYTWGIDGTTAVPLDGQWSDQGPRSSGFAGDRRALKRAVKHSYARRSKYVHAGSRVVSHIDELFGEAPGGGRNSLSYAQLRACLRVLIRLEIARRGDPNLKNAEHFMFQLAEPAVRPGSSFFRSQSDI